ncbi:MAG: 30S ribosomal protein S17 [Legionellales bacterium]|nr:30S ribosomal protein S17 [Legionellales bacterium]|tara:strand:+ start:132 stop:392 length:261 start_codon:yes stop_codon:yes gene_type:complete
MSAEGKVKRSLTGTVVSNKGEKTVVVEVTRKVRHRIYKKYITKSKKFHAHDEANTCNIGDIVKIVESKPISKLKTWVLDTVIEKTK